jgi:hypothetical protein
MRLMHEVPALEFAKAFDKGVARNTPHSRAGGNWQCAHAAVRGQIRALGKVRKGDVVDLDLDPTRGLNLQPQWHTARRTDRRR